MSKTAKNKCAIENVVLEVTYDAFDGGWGLRFFKNTEFNCSKQNNEIFEPKMGASAPYFYATT